MSAQYYPIAQPRHELEAEALRFLRDQLPNNYHLYANIDLTTGRSGETYEHDAIVVAPHAVFTVEIKSWGGRITGNRDRWVLADNYFVQSPIPLVLAKARCLKGLLQAKRLDLASLWVQGLVFLSAPDASPRISPDYEQLVVTRADVIQALVDPASWQLNRRPTPQQLSSVLKVLSDGAPARQMARLGPYDLLQRLEADERPYTLWLGKHRFDNSTHLLHVYTLHQTQLAQRSRCRDLAMREKEAYDKLYGCPDLLRYHSVDIPPDADPACVVLSFEDTTPLLPLPTWVTSRRPRLSHRLKVAARIARALAHVHDRRLVHRRLTPEAVLVSNEDEPASVRLTGFELARDYGTTAQTISGGSYSGSGFRCVAPEVIRTHETLPASDLFSLGATLFEVFTGTRLFQSTDEVHQEVTPAKLSLLKGQVAEKVIQLLQQLLKLDPQARPRSAHLVADELERIVTPPPADAPAPALVAGRVLHDTYELMELLGRGATGVVWKALHLQRNELVALKTADPEHAPALRNELKVLQSLNHAHLLPGRELLSFEAGSFLVLDFVDALSAEDWRIAGDELTPQQLLTVATGFLDAVQSLHRTGWLHRDIKPENLLLRVADLHPFLNDLGLATEQGLSGELAVGTARYKDPLLWREQLWTPANDLFAAFLVLYELLTGMYPFPSGTPVPDLPPQLEPDEFPTSFSLAQVEALIGLFSAALAPERSARPASVQEALSTLSEILSPRAPSPAEVREPLAAAPAALTVLPTTPSPMTPTATASPTAGSAAAAPTPASPSEPSLAPSRQGRLPADLTLQSSLEVFSFSARTRGAFARLGLTTVDALRTLPREALDSLPNVGSKTRNEMLGLQAAFLSRWPLPSAPLAEVIPRPLSYFPPLVADPRSISELGTALTPALRAGLESLGVTSLKDLCSLPEAVLRDIPGVGVGRLTRVREALNQLAGLVPQPETLWELNERLKQELGHAVHQILAYTLGFVDGQAHTPAEAAEHLGLTRQRTSMPIDFEHLQKDASVGVWLAELISSLVPAIGFTSLDALAESLQRRLPAPESGALHPMGFARLGALLLDPEPTVAQARLLDVICLPPWDPAQVQTLRGRLSSQANWPPVSRATLALQLWDCLDEALRLHLTQSGLDERLLLDALLTLCPDVLETRAGFLLTPPVPFELAAAWMRPQLAPRLSLQALDDQLRETFHAITPPLELAAALRSAGYRLVDSEVQDVERAPEQPEAPLVDALIPRQQLDAQRNHPPALHALAAAAPRGGFRVLVLPPAQHHALAPRLAHWLGELLQPEQVLFVDVDRILLTALKEADLWDEALFYDARAQQSWRWTHATLTQALERALEAACPGRVTVLGRPSLLGTLDMMSWLSAFYERARGGRFGLIVLAMPGGIHDNRLRLNERYNLAYTPDMAAVYLEVSPLHSAQEARSTP